jgi:hypothetical protein
MQRSILLGVGILATIVAIQFTLAQSTKADSHCHDTGIGLDANYINESPTGSFTVTCDIGIYVNEVMSLNGVEIGATAADAQPVQYGIYVDGASVNVRGAAIATDDNYPHQFVAVTYRDGASGKLSDSAINGAHRAAVLVRGEGTHVLVHDNEIVGSGPKDTGWAENGVQIDQGATADVRHNSIRDHWWDEDTWVSSAVLVVGDGSSVQHNEILNNDLGIYLLGDGNDANHNTIRVSYEDSNIAGLYGIYVSGDQNGVRQNDITSTVEPGAGLGLGVDGNGNKLIKNTAEGWETNIWVNGPDNLLPKPFQQPD